LTLNGTLPEPTSGGASVLASRDSKEEIRLVSSLAPPEDLRKCFEHLTLDSWHLTSDSREVGQLADAK
jgi:hypothetical protein